MAGRQIYGVAHDLAARYISAVAQVEKLPESLLKPVLETIYVVPNSFIKFLKYRVGNDLKRPKNQIRKTAEVSISCFGTKGYPTLTFDRGLHESFF